MKLLISSDFLGTIRHLVYDGKDFSWSSTVPDGIWTYGLKNSDCDIGFIANSLDFFNNPFLDSPYAISIGELGSISIGDVPWFQTMPRHAFLKYLQELLDQLWSVANDESNSYYRHYLVKYRKLLCQLQSPVIDTVLAKKIISNSHIGVGAEVSKFIPEKSNKAPATVYNLTGSVTGRLTVSSGPNILTLKKENRQIFESGYKGGKIIQIDISSLEPRIALSIAGKEPPPDIYTFVCEELFGGRLDRDHSKIAILSCIYGASQWTLAEKLPDSVDVAKVMDEIKRFFGIRKLSKRLSKEAESGFIKNLYGRNVESSKSHVNHFLQSTGVDVSFHVFDKIINEMNVGGFKFKPLYIIHDAIVLDVSPEAYKDAIRVSNLSFKVPDLDCYFPTKLEIIKE